MPTFARSRFTSCFLSRMFLAVEEDLALGALAGIQAYMRLNVRSSVDLPQPDGPMKAVTLLRAMSRLTFLRPWNLP
jgi:hypothetical protein